MSRHFTSDLLTQIRATFAYDPETGELKRIDGKGRRPRGNAKTPYPQVKVGKLVLYRHIVAWWLMTGEDVPDGFEIDHADRKPLNCRWRNLRLVTSSANKLNTDTRCNNTSGVRGVSPTRSGTWDARVKVDGRLILLGRHKTFEAAVAARRAAEIQHFGGPLADLHDARREP